jgi:hypothetical protein
MLQGKLEEAVRQFNALSPVERMSMIALQAIGYVASETFMGVIESETLTKSAHEHSAH